jgi:hypothetical protein
VLAAGAEAVQVAADAGLEASTVASPGMHHVRALLAPFRPGRFAERATQVLLDVESVFRDPPHRAAPPDRTRAIGPPTPPRDPS